MLVLAEIFHRIIQLCVLVVIIKVLLSYFVPPYNQIRQYIDRVVEPFLAPIRRVVPLVGMLDFSPMILIVLLMILDTIITGLLRSLV